MDRHVEEFFSQASKDNIASGNFRKVFPVHKSPKLRWDQLEDRTPTMCKGWYELGRLKTADRIEFLRDYWLTKLPYDPKDTQMIKKFFESLDDIGIFVVQKKFEDLYQCYLVYSLKDNEGFYYGSAAATDVEIADMKRIFPDRIVPEDFLAFLKIHNGFAKATDTGILSTLALEQSYQQFQALLKASKPLQTTEGNEVDPTTLIPFYESFGMPVFQCFWSEWYPEHEMGNVYYSGFSHTISDTSRVGAETMAFSSFLDWLAFYLEII